jgi:tRNA(Ile)-lysidine synthase
LLDAGGNLATSLDVAVFGECRIASRIGGERIRLPNRLHHHLLKHLLQEAQVPPWERQRIPLLFAGDGELLAAGDVVIGARLQAWCEPRGLSLRWQRPSPAGN